MCVYVLLQNMSPPPAKPKRYNTQFYCVFIWLSNMFCNNIYTHVKWQQSEKMWWFYQKNTKQKQTTQNSKKTTQTKQNQKQKST